MLNKVSNKFLLFLFIMSTTFLSAENSQAEACNPIVAKLAKTAKSMVYNVGIIAGSKCFNARNDWKSQHRNAISCIKNNTTNKRTKNTKSVTNSRKILGKLINMQQPSCITAKQTRRNRNNYYSLLTTRTNQYSQFSNIDNHIKNISKNIIEKKQTKNDPTKSDEFNKLVQLSDKMSLFLANNEDGYTKALNNIKVEKKKVDNKINQLAQSSTQDSIDRAKDTLKESTNVLEQAIKDNSSYKYEFPKVIAEMSKIQQTISYFFEDNPGMPKVLAVDAAFTNNRKLKNAMSNMNRIINEKIQSTTRIRNLSSDLYNAKVKIPPSTSAIKKLETLLNQEKIKPTKNQHVQNVIQGVKTLVSALSNPLPQTKQGRTTYKRLIKIANSPKIMTKITKIKKNLSDLAKLNSAINEKLLSYSSTMNEYKNSNDIIVMRQSVGIAKDLLKRTMFSLDYYTRSKLRL